MKIYLVSLGCGLLVGVIYSLLQVRSPAPPVVALVGLLGILLGEQALPLLRWIGTEAKTAAVERRLPQPCLDHLFGELPSAHRASGPACPPQPPSADDRG
ncbi:DUF1427 family protein [Albimonas pacifica]|uniref:XapX domain-containing protein n=1 Tax=Albimonas pacifica TaxID=1114924 RepID=A0A1I3GYD2_9RHOB|nr:DUF1427 family protein [Albimonas pacifica]SFI28391.1 XapX domain-containing protein [Albimonas pacifica]